MTSVTEDVRTFYYYSTGLQKACSSYYRTFASENSTHRGATIVRVSSRFAESRFAEYRLSFSFHHFHFKFLSLMRYNLFMGVNEMRVQILRLLCRLGLVLRLGSV